ncbi:MAG: LysM peptidoglycan-binding domain-containing protein [Gammaproteobacteria bacterium]|nr:LysM peptidoglycan-binding domain-containing protein [Gammaproteobacteria bacterium]MYF02184.1 LysM peptidoglycan-binding domain-containing protein [Gammaproteobacteria bacterium]MYI76681.1 LysM peptidoglycan-binding domain-containing protein [Gammaproteobacteria bacterium]
MYIRKILLSSVLGALAIAYLSGCAPIVPAPTIERVIVPIDRDSRRVYHYYVKSGDTLYAISRLHGLSVDQIAQMNDIAEPYVIHPGQRLVVDYELISREGTSIGDAIQSNPQKQISLASQKDNSTSKANTSKTESSGVKVTKMPRPPTTRQVSSLNTSQSDKTAVNTKESEQKTSPNSGRTQNKPIADNRPVTTSSDEVVAESSTAQTNTVTEPKTESPAPSKQAPIETASNEVSKQSNDSSTASAASEDDASPSFVARTEPINALPESASEQSVESLPKGWTWPVSASPTNSFGKDDGLNYFLNQGNQVVAAASGRITYAGVALSDFKYMVLIKTPDDYVIQYDFNVDLSVQENDLVSKGQDLVKIVNNSKRQQSTGSDEYRKVFFAIRKKGVPQDPNKLIGKPKAKGI